MKKILVVGASGKLYRDQQGTADTFTYNYWSSPVGIIDEETKVDLIKFHKKIFLKK